MPARNVKPARTNSGGAASAATIGWGLGKQRFPSGGAALLRRLQNSFSCSEREASLLAERERSSAYSGGTGGAVQATIALRCYEYVTSCADKRHTRLLNARFLESPQLAEEERGEQLCCSPE